MKLIQLLLLVMSAMTYSPESKSLAQAEKKTTCGIRRLEKTLDMMLTCYFHDNISAVQKDFTVYFYQEGRSPKPVVSCGWNPEITCDVAAGYRYEYDIDVHPDHTNVQLLNAGEEHVGMYTCQVIHESNPGTCNFTKDQIPLKSTLTPNTQQTSRTLPAQTTTSSLPDDRQTQSADEQSSAASKLSAPKDAPGGSLAEEQKQTGTQDNTLVVVVPSVVLSVLLGIAIIAIIFAAYWRRRQRRSSTTVNERSDQKKRQEEKTLLDKRQQDEHHSDISPPNPDDGQLTVEEDRQQTHVESGRQQETEVKTRCKTDGDSCLEADSKPLMSESFELEKTGIQELGDVHAEDDETSFDGRQPELQQRDSHIDAPKKLNKEEEEDSPVPLH